MQMKIWFRDGSFRSLVEVNGFLIRGHGHQPLISTEVSLYGLVHIWAYHIHMFWRLTRGQQLSKDYYQRHLHSVNFYGIIAPEAQEYCTKNILYKRNNGTFCWISVVNATIKFWACDQHIWGKGHPNLLRPLRVVYSKIGRYQHSSFPSSGDATLCSKDLSHEYLGLVSAI